MHQNYDGEAQEVALQRTAHHAFLHDVCTVVASGPWRGCACAPHDRTCLKGGRVAVVTALKMAQWRFPTSIIEINYSNHQL
eukprot:m.234288 g.234288  ORF g.234288 m.234288 type:complete len:81 (-) comp15254_c0_seq5:1511-1753(-)